MTKQYDYDMVMKDKADCNKNVTRESVEKELMQEGNSFKLKGIDLLI